MWSASPIPSPRISSDENRPDATIRLFWLLAAAHLALWMAVSLLTQPNIPLDMLEMVFWGDHPQWGYHKHPPLPAWVAYAATHFFGRTIWPLYLASHLSMLVAIWGVWRLARDILRPWPALAAAALLESCFCFTYMTCDWNHNLAVRPFWSLAVLCLYWAVTKDQLRFWIASGVVLGVGMLSKYDMGVLVLSFMLWAVWNPLARRKLFRVGPYLTTVIALLIFAPHLRWVYEHQFSTFSYIVSRSDGGETWAQYLWHPLDFFIGQIHCFIPLMFAAVPVTGWLWQWGKGNVRAENSDDAGRLTRSFLWVVGLLPLLLFIVISLATASSLRGPWGSCLWTHFGLVWIYFLGSYATEQNCRRVVGLSLCGGLLLAGLVTGINLSSPYQKKIGSRFVYPGSALSAEVVRRWEERFPGRPLPMIGGPWWVAGNAAFYAPHHVEIYGDLDPAISPGCSDETLKALGGVIVWPLNPRAADEFIVPWKDRFLEAEREQVFELTWQTGAAVPPVKIGMAIVPPQTLAKP